MVYSAFVLYGPLILITLIQTVAYPDFRSAWAAEDLIAYLGSVVVVAALVWSVVVSYLGVVTKFNVTRWKARLWFLIFPFIFYGLALIGVLALLLMSEYPEGFGGLSSEAEELSPEERELVLYADDLAAWEPWERPDSQYEDAFKETHTDGSVYMQYEYDGIESAVPLAVTYRVAFEVSESETLRVYQWWRDYIDYTTSSDNGNGLQLVDRSDLLQWGQESELYFVMSDDYQVGMAFLGRKDLKLVLCMIFLLQVEDESEWAELLTPYLEKLEQHQ
jgi:hypothetical protein